MDGRAVHSIHEIIHAAVEAKLAFSSEIWWRGHARTEWSLRPGVHRVEATGMYEKNISVRFVQRSRARHPNCPPNGDFPAWLFFMQHYGLPTRLLDWTESVLVASYFAVTEAGDDPGALWCLSPYHLNEKHVGVRRNLTPHHEKALPLFLPPFANDAPTWIEWSQ
jgi:hypothetical protein